MIIVLDPHSGIPVYRQLMEQITFHVASGLLAPGEELPSTRVLSSDLGVNPMTVSKAYNLLERDGLIERRPGLPVVVRGLPTPEMGATKREQLRRSLHASGIMARQLGITTEEALETFRRLLLEEDGSSKEERS